METGAQQKLGTEKPSYPADPAVRVLDDIIADERDPGVPPRHEEDLLRTHTSAWKGDGEKEKWCV